MKTRLFLGLFIALFAVHSAFGQTTPKLINIATRGISGPGDNTLIAGFVVSGRAGEQIRVLIRAVGPTLAQSFGVSTALRSPRLILFNSAGMQARENTGWDADSPRDTDANRAAATATGAFPLPAGSKDCAMTVFLFPGNYTAHVTSTDGATGVALIEVYEVPR